MFGFRGDGFDFQGVYVMIMADLSLTYRFNILMGNEAALFTEATDNCSLLGVLLQGGVKIHHSIKGEYSKSEHTSKNSDSVHLLQSFIEWINPCEEAPRTRIIRTLFLYVLQLPLHHKETLVGEN